MRFWGHLPKGSDVGGQVGTPLCPGDSIAGGQHAVMQNVLLKNEVRCSHGLSFMDRQWDIWWIISVYTVISAVVNWIYNSEIPKTSELVGFLSKFHQLRPTKLLFSCGIFSKLKICFWEKAKGKPLPWATDYKTSFRISEHFGSGLWGSCAKGCVHGLQPPSG